MRYYDITVTLGTESVNYPGDMPYSRTIVESLENGGPCNLSSLKMSSHAGTHIDSPSHYIPKASCLSDYPVSYFIMPAVVIDFTDRDVIDPNVIAHSNVRQGDGILFKTRNSEEGICTAGFFRQDYISLTPRAAKICVEKKVRMVGIDGISVDPFNDETYAVHHELLANNILILEGANLKGVPPARYTLYCLPLKIAQAEASPVRAVLASINQQ